MERRRTNLTHGGITAGDVLVLRNEPRTATPVVVVQQPSPVTAYIGNGVQFSVQATGATEYHWRRNGVRISDNSYFGARTATLQRGNARWSDHLAVFDCVISNGCTAVVSQASTLTLHPCRNADIDSKGQAGTEQDIALFFRCLAGSCCFACMDSDFDLDGDFGTDQDIERFITC